MSLAFGGLGLAPQTGTLTRLSYPGTDRLKAEGKLNHSFWAPCGDPHDGTADGHRTRLKPEARPQATNYRIGVWYGPGMCELDPAACRSCKFGGSAQAPYTAPQNLPNQQQSVMAYAEAFIWAQEGFSSITQRNFFCRAAVYIFSHWAPISSVHALKTRGSM